MSSKRSNKQSIGSQLVLLFTLAAALLLTCALGICYLLVIRHALEEDNAALTDKISVVSHDVRQFGPDKAVATETPVSSTGEHSAYWIRILDQNENTLRESGSMESSLPKEIFPPPGGADNLKPKSYRVGSRLFSLVSTIQPVGGSGYVIQLAQDRSVDERFQREFGIVFFAVLSLSILACIAVAHIATNRGLKPLADMTGSVKRIGPTRLNERVQPEKWPQELQPLAAAFDQMLNRLEDSFTRLSQFSADLAHELRTPISNILGEAQVSLTRDRSPGEYREVIESIVAECESLSLIVDNLLFLARAESAREQIVRTKFEGRDAIEKVAGFYDTVAEDRNVRIDCSGSGTINADRILFERAISNLVENALRFTPDGGQIKVTLTTNNGEARIAVSDTGCGIAPEHVPRVFDRLYRVDPSRSAEGTGLGLALVKSIAELHGGAAALTSRVNEGTTVILSFPN